MSASLCRSRSSHRSLPRHRDILEDFKAFLQKLENISWVKTVANTTGNFNKFAPDISDLSEHDSHYQEDSSAHLMRLKKALPYGIQEYSLMVYRSTPLWYMGVLPYGIQEYSLMVYGSTSLMVYRSKFDKFDKFNKGRHK